MNAHLFRLWKQYIPDLVSALRNLQEKTIIAVGTAVFPRIIPSLFLKKYIIYSIRDTSDTEILRKYAKIFYLEEHDPIRAAKAESTSYLLGNYQFQKFVKSRRPFRLLLYTTNREIITIATRQRFEWIGNRPSSFR